MRALSVKPQVVRTGPGEFGRGHLRHRLTQIVRVLVEIVLVIRAFPLHLIRLLPRKGGVIRLPLLGGFASGQAAAAHGQQYDWEWKFHGRNR